MHKVTLTFDNGPDPEFTPKVLDCLARHGVKATFFLVGQKVADNHDLIDRALAEGHAIGNHTFTHSGPLGLKDASVAVDEVARTNEALSFLKAPVRMFRPVGGGGRIGPHLLQASVVDHLVANRYSLVLWNSVPGDWRDPDGWLAKALADCQSQEWSLVVLHDHRPGGLQHLDEFLRRLREEGCELTQEIPISCMPMIQGEIMQSLQPFITPAHLQ